MFAMTTSEWKNVPPTPCSDAGGGERQGRFVRVRVAPEHEDRILGLVVDDDGVAVYRAPWIAFHVGDEVGVFPEAGFSELRIVDLDAAPLRNRTFQLTQRGPVQTHQGDAHRLGRIAPGLKTPMFVREPVPPVECASEVRMFRGWESSG